MAVKDAKYDTRKYFTDMYGYYRFFTGRNGEIDIAPSMCGEMEILPLQELKDAESFDRYAAKFYNRFLEDSYRTALSHNFYQIIQARLQGTEA